MPSVPRLEALARIGFAARGVMYVLIGILALFTGRSEDGAGALEQLNSGFGRLLLGVMAVGFLGYGLWRVSDAIYDSEGNGSGAKGIAVRAGGAASGIIHLGLCVLAASMTAGTRQGSGGDSTRQGAAATLDLPGGEMLLLIAGIALLATGAIQLSKAWRADFLRNLDSEAASRLQIKRLGQAGFTARGIVFLVMGWFLIRAGWESRSSEAGGMGQALASLNPTIHALVAAGLLLFGLFSFVEARHRRINDPKVLDRLRSSAARIKHPA
ncbi:DUF1206 domain-containing protein [Sphingosinicella sp. BN140058]|uniref:DUF1206 domain-containing protein n=1 Tax=Sphingosinicella sp. BN140058 TaxID=1892855 RepID=UPI001012ECFC|nr:DUF1206 domain-containing protein [Sphingosinicella sp. BN140058]QAY75759.1 DUF1206 domain-containing protein [Sphingosinicella sp. BN140058]